jgi:hypothetical protein
MLSDFSHLVCYEESMRQIVIYRIDASGQRILFSKMQVPNSSGWSKEAEHLAKQLGENLLLDSPVARRLLAI